MRKKYISYQNRKTLKLIKYGIFLLSYLQSTNNFLILIFNFFYSFLKRFTIKNSMVTTGMIFIEKADIFIKITTFKTIKKIK